ncbi:periodic tryptophan protein 2 homolog [Neodiprion virginianus]|uniref:periodic tryptophan protein 2 homolog n=1 Tax=Neodiprion virginianus TaxID=2961670 RepID=UPI001EE6B4EB|nr:periodic tryptophan protein 2 homolog [Neodiprion virginianus]XP_046624302.1 periodic tryptophan protein 2 homolog [Neodiprion virginianus]
MKFAYKFSNLLGTVYRKGNLIFSPDGYSVISPVGNRITIFDLKNNKSSTLPVESRFDYTSIDIAPNGSILIAVNEEGEASLISLISRRVIHKYRFKRRVRCIKFSPDGKHFAACKENNVFVFKAPGLLTGEFNPFVMERVFHGAFDETTYIDWSYDSKLLAVGSKDNSTRLYSLEKWANFKSYSLGSHTDSIVGCFFEKDSYDLSTISRNGQLCVWECSIDPDALTPWQPIAKKQKPQESESEDDIDFDKALEKTEKQKKKDKHVSNQSAADDAEDEKDTTDKESKVQKLFYKKLGRHYLGDEVRKQNSDAVLTSAAYHRDTKILVTGFSTGAFFIHEMPDVNMIHSLSISEQCISSIALNNTGDWIALGCSGLGQLLVWEWQSETYAMKQQGHSTNMSCLSYSPDGQYIVTGGDDGKVKLWNAATGFCTITFQEHSSAISDVLFSHNRKFVVSASLDGTVRAYDMTRYRNFRTLVSPRPVQFSCVALDASDEFLAAGGQDVFEIFLWSMKLGRLLEILAGHEGPVASLAFNPNLASSALASVSWDKTLKLWNAIESGSAHETIQLTADGLCVVYKPDGKEVAVATLDGQISFFDCKTAMQTSSIEGKNDLGSGRSDTDLVTAKKSLQGKAFTCLCYMADGSCILAGGQSKNVCIYNIQESVLLKKFEVTQNRSFDAVDDFINRRKMTEFGNVALVEDREENEGGKVSLRLPGVRKGDMASRSIKPEVRVYSLQFSPTGQSWAAATTEGLLIYSLDMGLVFDPFELEFGITPQTVKETLFKREHARALMMALKLNEKLLIQEVIENVPYRDIELTITSLPDVYVERVLKFVASELENTRHIHFYLIWINAILTRQGSKINSTVQMPVLLTLQKNMQRKYDELSKICDFNQYTIKYIQRLGEHKAAKEKAKSDGEETSEDELREGTLVEEMEVD